MVTRTVEHQRRGAFVRIVIDRIDDHETTPKQREKFEDIVRQHRGLSGGYLNAATVQIGWFRRKDLDTVLTALDDMERDRW